MQTSKTSSEGGSPWNGSKWDKNAKNKRIRVMSI